VRLGMEEVEGDEKYGGRGRGGVAEGGDEGSLASGGDCGASRLGATRKCGPGEDRAGQPNKDELALVL